MQKALFIKSSDGIYHNSKPEDFTVRFTLELTFDGSKTYYIALDNLSTSYSLYNISSEYGNNTVKYSSNSGTSWSTITIQDENHTYDDLNSIISDATSQKITIRFISYLFKVRVTLDDNHRLGLRSGNFADILGFDKKILTQTELGSKLPDITRSVDDLFIHTSVSESVVSGQSSSCLYRFSVDNLALSYPFHIEPKRLIWAKLNTNRFRDLRIQIKDFRDRPINLNGLPVSLTLIIKQGEDII